MNARSVGRIPQEDRWSADCVDWVKHVPWNRYKGDEEADGRIPEEKLAEEDETQSKGRGMNEIVVEMRQRVPG